MMRLAVPYAMAFVYCMVFFVAFVVYDKTLRRRVLPRSVRVRRELCVLVVHSGVLLALAFLLTDYFRFLFLMAQATLFPALFIVFPHEEWDGSSGKPKR